MIRFLFLLAAMCVGAVLSSPSGLTQAVVQNQPVLLAATSIPTSGVTTNILGGLNCSGGLACPPMRVAAYGGKFSNSSGATVYCALYASAPSLGTTAIVGTQVIVPTVTTVPFYWGPSNGISKGAFPLGIFAGCATGYLGSTGVAANVVGVEIFYL